MSQFEPTSTDLQISTDEAFKNIVNQDSVSGVYRTIQRFEPGDLPFGQQLYARARHGVDGGGGVSDWSGIISFQITRPYSIIGVCYNPGGSTAERFPLLDADGNHIESSDAIGSDPYGFSIRQADVMTHPVWQAISNATIEVDLQDSAHTKINQEMIKVPLFYIRVEPHGIAGTYCEDKLSWWVCDEPAPGFQPHPCFFRNSEEDEDGKLVPAEFVYWGKWGSSVLTSGVRSFLQSVPGNDITLLTSYAGPGGDPSPDDPDPVDPGNPGGPTTPSSTTNYDWTGVINSYINPLNQIEGQAGWRLFDVWDAAAFRLLMLIASGYPGASGQSLCFYDTVLDPFPPEPGMMNPGSGGRYFITSTVFMADSRQYATHLFGLHYGNVLSAPYRLNDDNTGVGLLTGVIPETTTPVNPGGTTLASYGTTTGFLAGETLYLNSTPGNDDVNYDVSVLLMPNRTLERTDKDAIYTTGASCEYYGSAFHYGIAMGGTTRQYYSALNEPSFLSHTGPGDAGGMPDVWRLAKN